MVKEGLYLHPVINVEELVLILEHKLSVCRFQQVNVITIVTVTMVTVTMVTVTIVTVTMVTVTIVTIYVSVLL